MVCNRVSDLNPPVSGMVEPSVAGGDFRRHQPDPVLLMRIGCTLVLAQMGNGCVQNRMHATDMDGDKPHCARGEPWLLHIIVGLAQQTGRRHR